jgi:hypothetical protein
VKDWRRLFSRAANSGVYFDEGIAGAAEIRSAAESLEFTFFRLDLQGTGGRQRFLKVAADAFQFPEYFGENWDAFADCLTDFAWCKAKGYVLLIENMESFADTSPEDMSIARGIFEDAAGHWKKQGTPFFVVFAKRREGSAQS